MRWRACSGSAKPRCASNSRITSHIQTKSPPPDFPAWRTRGRSMKILYLDAFAGISGDMMLGALLALGLPLHELEQELARLPLHGYSITATPRQISGISAIKFD